MSDRNVEESIINSLRKLGCDAKNILPVHDLQGDLGVDSTEMIELAALVRGEFGIVTQRIDLDGVRTVADLTGRVESLLDQVSHEVQARQMII